MAELTGQSWTDADFESLSWHDTHVHALRVVAGEHGPGELVLDLDYILEWRCEPGGGCDFVLAPATLTFRQVTDLRVRVDWAGAQAALGPFSLAEIRRTQSQGGPGTGRYRWLLAINWPTGEVAFEAAGFVQVLRGPAVVKGEQWIEPGERAGFDTRAISI